MSRFKISSLTPSAASIRSRHHSIFILVSGHSLWFLGKDFTKPRVWDDRTDRVTAAFRAGTRRDGRRGRRVACGPVESSELTEVFLSGQADAGRFEEENGAARRGARLATRPSLPRFLFSARVVRRSSWGVLSSHRTLIRALSARMYACVLRTSLYRDTWRLSWCECCILANYLPRAFGTLGETHTNAHRLRGKVATLDVRVCADAHGRLSPAAGVGEAARARLLRVYMHLRALYVCVRARAAGIPRRRLLSLARVLNPPGKIDNGRRESIPDKQARRQAGRQAVRQAGRQAGQTGSIPCRPHTREIFGFGISRAPAGAAICRWCRARSIDPLPSLAHPRALRKLTNAEAR